MTLLEYIKQGGKCKSKAGHWFYLGEISTGPYPIRGYLSIDGKNYPYSWTEDGVPENLPYTHGLDLMPVIPVVTYKMIKTKLLERYISREDFEHDAKFI